MTQIKKHEVVDMYRKLLDPMGYTVVEKKRPKSLFEQWKPKKTEADLYAEMSLDKLGKEVTRAETEKAELQAKILDIKRDTVDYLKRVGPSLVTQGIFRATMAGVVVDKRSIVVECEKLNELTSLISYLKETQRHKLIQELATGLKKTNPDIISFKKREVFGGQGGFVIKI